MSMISNQCDELRKAADELQDIIDNAHNYTWSGLIVILGYAQRGLRQAADIIWELRCKLAGVVDQQDEIERLEDENAKLQERVEWLDGECRKSMGASHKFFEMVGEYQKENAKLRELVRTMMRFFEDDDWCTTCWCAKECDAQEQYEDDCLMRDVFHNLMRALGVEVDK